MMEEKKKFVPTVDLVVDHWLTLLGIPAVRLVDELSGGMIFLTIMATRDVVVGHLDDLVAKGTVDPEAANAVQEEIARLDVAKDMATLYAAIVAKSSPTTDMEGWGTIKCDSSHCIAVGVPHACFSLGETPVSGVLFTLSEAFRAVEQYWRKGQITPQQAAVLFEQMVNAGLATDDTGLLATIANLPHVRQHTVKAWVQGRSPRLLLPPMIYVVLFDPFGESGRVS